LLLAYSERLFSLADLGFRRKRLHPRLYCLSPLATIDISTSSDKTPDFYPFEDRSAISNRDGLFARDRRKSFQKIFERVAAFEVIEEIPDGDSRPGEKWRAADLLHLDLDHVVL
jgi:hypothetical protein